VAWRCGELSQQPTCPRFKKARRLLYEKYPQYPQNAALGEGDVIVEITPRHVFSWGLD